jgi:uncharacterized protein (DUF433 family)
MRDVIESHWRRPEPADSWDDGHPDEYSATDEVMTFERITVRPEQMGGVPCIRGLRIPVASVVAMVADGMGEEEILAAHPDLESEDIREALHYAAEAVRERELPLAAVG